LEFGFLTDVFPIKMKFYETQASLLFALILFPVALCAKNWKKHLIQEGFRTNTAVAADFDSDGDIDVISNSGTKTRLFLAPDWQEVILDATPQHSFIHSEVTDVDGDGDPDYIGARYKPGLIAWMENPGGCKARTEPWPLRVACEDLNGIHGVIIGDVNKDGRADLVANSGQPDHIHPNSAAWLEIPQDPKSAGRWTTHIFADKDAPGLSHYMGVGDVNGDGRLDITIAAKGGFDVTKFGKGEWFAWYEAPADPSKPFTRHELPGVHPGATNIHPADVNGDGRTDLVASRGHGEGLIWFENPSWEIHTIHCSLKSPHCLQVLDMDGDGDIDAATCAYESKIAAWFENDGKGNFTTHVVDDDQAAYDIRAIDMDGDSDIDFLIAGQGSNNVVWLENPSK
jgi:hypothetical protein